MKPYAFNCRRLTAEARVRYQVSMCGICRGRSGTGTGFFTQYFGFLLSISLRQFSLLILILRGLLSEGHSKVLSEIRRHATEKQVHISLRNIFDKAIDTWLSYPVVTLVIIQITSNPKIPISVVLQTSYKQMKRRVCAVQHTSCWTGNCVNYVPDRALPLWSTKKRVGAGKGGGSVVRDRKVLTDNITALTARLGAPSSFWYMSVADNLKAMESTESDVEREIFWGFKNEDWMCLVTVFTRTD